LSKVAKKSVAYKSNRLPSLLLGGVLLAMAVGAAYLTFELGRIRAGYDVVEAAAERDELEDRIKALENEKLALSEQVAMLETHRNIDREAYGEVERSLQKLQAKIQEQQDAIAFYRGIVSPADGKAGLRVQAFHLSRGPHEREYNVRLVLIQAMKHDRKVSGDVSLQIAGLQDGQQKSYAYRELVPEDGSSKWDFSFRYFQDFDRLVVLPDGFEPETVTVQVESKTKSIDSIEKSYAWLSSQG
jgi:Family of unknown function (DUF6776)